jgi:hypothetical protein
MIKKILFVFALIIESGIILSQGPSLTFSEKDILQRLKNYRYNNTEISIYLDPLIEANYYKHILYNQKYNGAMGYQLRIFSGSGPKAKEEAEKTRSLFLSKYEHIRAYLVYDTPDYKVYVGDCRTQSEMLKLINQVKGDFPNAFQVFRRINVSYE